MMAAMIPVTTITGTTIMARKMRSILIVSPFSLTAHMIAVCDRKIKREISPLGKLDSPVGVTGRLQPLRKREWLG